MIQVKAYWVETRKKSYIALGTSLKDVKNYVEDNKRDLDLTFDMSGYFKVTLNKDIWVNWYDMCDEYVDVINLTNESGEDVQYKFSTDSANENLLLDESLRV